MAEARRRFLASAFLLPAAMLRMEIGRRQIPTIRRYESEGFVRIPAFGEYVGDPTSVCFQKRIVG